MLKRWKNTLTEPKFCSGAKLHLKVSKWLSIYVRLHSLPAELYIIPRNGQTSVSVRTHTLDGKLKAKFSHVINASNSQIVSLSQPEFSLL